MISCAPEDLNAAAKCFQCLSEKEMLMIQTYLLSVIAGGSTDPDELLALAKDFQSISDKALTAIQDYLLCQIAA